MKSNETENMDSSQSTSVFCFGNINWTDYITWTSLIKVVLEKPNQLLRRRKQMQSTDFPLYSGHKADKVAKVFSDIESSSDCRG